jgi:hypothetical protein
MSSPSASPPSRIGAAATDATLAGMGTDATAPPDPTAFLSPEVYAQLLAWAKEARERGDDEEAQRLEESAELGSLSAEQLSARLEEYQRDLTERAIDELIEQAEVKCDGPVPPQAREQVRGELRERFKQEQREYQRRVQRGEIEPMSLHDILGVTPVRSDVAPSTRPRERRPGTPRARQGRASRRNQARGDPDSDEPPGGRLHNGRHRRRPRRRWR